MATHAEYRRLALPPPKGLAQPAPSDVVVNRNGSGAGLMDGLLGMMLHSQASKSNGKPPFKPPVPLMKQTMTAELETEPIIARALRAKLDRRSHNPSLLNSRVR